MTKALVLVVVLFGSILLTGSAISQTAPSDGYMAVVKKSDGRKVGQQFTFANLRTPRPFVTYPSGNGAEINKVFEDDELIVLIFVADLTGSTETFYLNKKNKHFTLIEAGALEATVRVIEIVPKVTHGNLQSLNSEKCGRDIHVNQLSNEELCKCLGLSYNASTKACE